jgi:hypothetical protein
MAVLMEMEIETTPENYDAIENALDGRGNPPDGLIIHTAQDLGNGRMRIVDVWESPEAFGAFAETRLGPTIGQTLGDDAPPAPEPQFKELHNSYTA